MSALIDQMPLRRTPGDQHEGADGSDSIWVSVNERGQVCGVDVSRQWRSRLDVTGFAGGLFEAYQEAVCKALEAAALVALTAGPAVPAGDDGGTWPLRELDEQDDRLWWESTWSTLDRLQTRRELLTAQVASPEMGERVVSSPDGCLTVRLYAGTCVGIDGDVHRIAGTDPERLRSDALAVFRAAGLTVGVSSGGRHG